jgi:glycerate 2-kinase
MKVIIAPDSLKGSLTVLEVEQANKRGFARTDASLESVIVLSADEGERTVQSKIDPTNGKIITANVNYPPFWIIKSFYRILGVGINAVIEMGLAFGLSILSVQERNPLRNSIFKIFLILNTY